MPRSDQLIRSALRASGAVSPALGASLALRTFFATAPRMAVREADAATDLDARRRRVTVRGNEVVAYQWGDGTETALLLHGWRGRASQFSPLVRELVAAGLRVVSFDAPAHGASKGRRTDIRDWLEAVRLLDDGTGFDTIIGHSFGGLAALTAARHGVRARAVAVVSGAASPAAFLRVFGEGLGLDAATRARFEERFRARMGVDAADLVAQYDAVADPLPPGVELLVVHDRADRQMPDTDALRLHEAHGGRSTLLRTEGLGHSRILADDRVLDALVSLTTGQVTAPENAANAAPPVSST
ncbi:pimeloyl-ACP methyl ester carboxylesterase [Microbacterium resistens]|uniref:Pimeloyl-ACP methyl ester carboxylesterase n=1 Tax=Microbacterium resistens TaxID=156977 RepID=A0ABU1SAK0_9MICO|nr:alpha/beta fold hydrolase [Microbacterium resistens]MDR6866636.1 pimeloyl-ACP methyl ester carboxylesterase [Microbacterium resistens]